MINTIIFSKNNPLGLQGLLDSIETNWMFHPLINLLIKETHLEYGKQYREIDTRNLMNPYCFRYDSGDLKNDILNITKHMDFDYTMFLTDRDRVCSPFVMEAASMLRDPEISGVYCNDTALVTSAIHGTIFRTKDVTRYLRGLSSLESPGGIRLLFEGKIADSPYGSYIKTLEED